MKFQVGDLVVQDCTMPYPNTIYKVEELDKYGNFRGPAVFRLTVDPKAYPIKKGQWFGHHAFRVIAQDELHQLAGKLLELIGQGGSK